MERLVKERLCELKNKISNEKEIIKRAWDNVHKTEGSNGLYALYGYKDVDGRSFAEDREKILERYEQEYENLKNEIREQKRIEELKEKSITEIINETINLTNDEKVINNLKFIREEVEKEDA